jgi:anaerobic magnesium-protoporphyrin IX monomethyl ester cyclase
MDVAIENYRVLFVDFTVSYYDRHPIYYIKSVLNRLAIQAFYIQTRDVEEIEKYINGNGINILMYTSFSNLITNYSEFDKKIKSKVPGLFSIMGGPGVTQMTERKMLLELGTTINAYCIGEGESALYNFFKNGMKFEKNIIRTTDLESSEGYYPYIDVDELDFPDREFVYEQDSILREMPSKQFMGSRGCPYRCTYCHNHTINEIFKSCGKTVRLKSVDYLIDEVLDVKSKYPLETAIFQDDIFYFHKKWSIEFALKWKEKVKIPWNCNIRPDYVNEEMIKVMAESGCNGVSWSIESGNEELRTKILDRKMKDDVILQCAGWLNKYGIRHRTGNIIGIPGETMENIYETIEINIKCKPYIANAHIFVPFKGLQLTNYAIKEGYIKESDLVDIPDTYFEETIINFTKEEKLLIRKLMFLFPILVSIPILYHNKKLFKGVTLINHKILYVINKLFVGVKSSRMFRVNGSLSFKFKMLYRFLRFGL